MDANKTKYHLIYGERDWLPLLLQQSSVDAWWDRDRQMISLAPVVKQLNDLSQGELLNKASRRGASYDHYGNIFWIDDAEEAICYHPEATPDQTGVYWQVGQLHECLATEKSHGDFKPVADTIATPVPVLRGLTVTAHEYLVVGTLNPGGLLVFDLHGGGPPSWLRWPESVGLYPYDLCSGPDGGFWILDSDFGSGRARVWHLDGDFRVLDCSGDRIALPSLLNNDFHDLVAPSGSPACDATERNRFLSGLLLNGTSPVLVEQPIAIEAIAANSFIVLDSPATAVASAIHYFVNGKQVATVMLDHAVTGELLAQASIVGHDFAFVPDYSETQSASAQHAICGNLYIAATHAQQSYLFSLCATPDSISLVLQPQLIPMRAYSGKALIASGKTAYYDYQDRWLPLVEQPRHSYRGVAQIDGIVKDGEEPDCVWHRIIVDACIPPGTEVRFETRAANSETELQNGQWQVEPGLYRRTEGAELPFYQPFADLPGSSDNTGSWDVLLQNAVGRFLQVRIVLRGNRHATPRVRCCRIYYPRFSYLERYLPDVYRDDLESASFLDRFLANIEGLYTSLEDKIARAESLFDNRTSPADFLEWLGGWLGAFIDPSWDEARKRLFIQNAFLLFKWRGTTVGLRVLLRLTIDPCPDDSIFDPLRQGGSDCAGNCAHTPYKHIGNDIRIVEHFLTRRDPGLATGQAQPDQAQLALVNADTLWSPDQGASALHKKYQSFLAQTYGDDVTRLNAQWTQSYTHFNDILFPPLMPQAAAQKRDWQHFTRDFIGFTYADVSSDDLSRYQDFLQRRYVQIAVFNAAVGLIGNDQLDSFDSITLPDTLPVDKTALTDWIEFVAIALPIARQAHTFTVLLPTLLGDLPSDLDVRRARVETIVEREKPAHTQFEVKYFWAMFQVGSARLGIDSHIGDGSRFVGLVLGANFLGQSFLSESHPWSVVDRTILGRERLTSAHEWRL